MRNIALVLAFVSLSACASAPPRESVVMTVGPDEAHVRLGKNRVAVGDEVVFKRNYCEPATKLSQQKCEMRVVGHARVTRFEGEEYSVVKVYEGHFQEGDLVEPAR